MLKYLLERNLIDGSCLTVTGARGCTCQLRRPMPCAAWQPVGVPRSAGFLNLLVEPASSQAVASFSSSTAGKTLAENLATCPGLKEGQQVGPRSAACLQCIYHCDSRGLTPYIMETHTTQSLNGTAPSPSQRLAPPPHPAPRSSCLWRPPSSPAATCRSCTATCHPREPVREAVNTCAGQHHGQERIRGCQLPEPAH